MNKRITIVKDDNLVTVDGVSVEFNFDIDSSIHAVQWFNTYGEIEYNDDRENEEITSIASFIHILNQFAAVVAQAAQDKQDEQAAYEASLTPQDRRFAEYPPIHEQLEALYDARHGDTTKLDAIDNAIVAVKLKYPLEVL